MTVRRSRFSRPLLAVLVLAAAGCATVPGEDDRGHRIRTLMETLAADSLRGRMTGSEGAASAARIIARELESYGVEPAGDGGYLQPVPLVRVAGDGRPRMAFRDEAQGEPVRARNVVGVVRGAELPDEAVVMGAHFDHVGVGRPVDGDSIYNGADDDASGVVAVLEAARALARGPAPRRTVVFLLSTGEELGLLGTRWYIREPAVPVERTVANLQVEMIGRPDSLAGGPGRAWLTGFERSTVGPTLREAGLPVVPDPRPDRRFFFRSDNIVFARLGVPAHTLSSYDLHRDYHRPSDEVGAVDLGHMERVTESVVRAVRLLADGPAPEWRPGGRPEARGR